MSTDEMIQEDIREAMSFETAPKQPRFQPAVPVKEIKNAFTQLRAKRDKWQNWGKAIEFAVQLLGIGMHGKPLQRSVQGQYSISTRAARAAISAAKPKKHRRR